MEEEIAGEEAQLSGQIEETTTAQRRRVDDGASSSQRRPPMPFTAPYLSLLEACHGELHAVG
eukprot:378654-Amphidinium_carterae.1